MATNDSETVLTGAAARAVYTALYQQLLGVPAGSEPNGTAAYDAVFTATVTKAWQAAYPPQG